MLRSSHTALSRIASRCHARDASTSADEKEEWIRKVPLMVLIYEGIVAQVYDYDYAPSSEIIHTRRIYFNTSQEGRNDVDVLR